MLSEWIVILIASIFFHYIIKQFQKRKKKYPPGPIGLPIVGYLPFLTRKPHIKLTELGKKYGDVFSMYLGSELVVVLNSADAIREAFGKREFLGRPPNTTATFFKLETPFFNSDMHLWKEHRRFVVQSMKDLGLGKSKIEAHIEEEIHHFLEVLGKSKGTPLNVVKPLTPSMSNNICSLVFGERYDYKDPARITMDIAIDSAARTGAQTALYLFFPWLIKIPFLPKIFKFDRALQDMQKVRDFINEKVRMHKETLDPKDKRDFIDSYLIEMKSRSEKDVQSSFSEKTLEGTAMVLFGAGSETVRTTINWCLYIVAAFPEIQKKVRGEIHGFLGRNRFPQFADQNNLTYTQAVIREVMRWQTTLPLNLMRYTIDDANVKGYDIPKGICVIANFHAAHHDEALWKDPENFRPERFIDSDGNLMKSINLMPFSVGKRACPGEAMATMEVFLYFVSILQRFKVALPENCKATFESELGLTNLLKPHKLCFLSD